jgi:2-polyprenyl-3-methyl-5-hydroxy-6-metoxy-1,4-benzoquinol methylase
VCAAPAAASPRLVGRDLLFETTSRTFELAPCSACGSWFLDPLPSQSELESFYPTKYWWQPSAGGLKALEGAYRRMVLRDHVAFIERAAAASRPRGKGRILDVGCGSATLLGILKRRGFEVQGFDASAEASRIAREVDGVDVAVGTRLHEGAFADASFDVVTLFHVLEHVTDPRGVLAAARKILRPGGCLVLQVPNVDSWQFRICGVRWYGLDVPRHVIDYSASAIERLLEGSGFAVRRVRHFNMRDNAPALASSVFPSLDPVSRGVRLHRRGETEPVALAWLRHALYFVAVIAACPVAIAESAAGRGATVTIEAERT